MFKSCFLTLVSIASMNLINLAAEEGTDVQVKEVQATTQHLNQDRLEDLVKSILKDSGKKWKLRTKVEGKKGNSAVYIPEDQTGSESFGIFIGEGNKALSVKSEENMVETLQKSLQKLHPGAKIVDFHVIKKDDQSLFAEWTIENISDPDLKSHSWIHGINCDDGLVILQYTNDMDKVDESRKVWEPLLEHASLK